MESESIRFSPKEYKPPTMDEKQFKLETDRYELKKQKEPYLERKIQIERQLYELNDEVKGNFLDDARYREVCKIQFELKKEKFKVEDGIKEFKKKEAVINREIDEIVFMSKKLPDDQVKTSLLELRDKYMSFASDTTRVSSMRAMSSKFVEEIQAILKVIK